MQFLPALIPAIALLLRHTSTAVRAAALALLGVQFALALALVWLRPSWGLGGERSPFFAALDAHHAPPLDHLMPRFDAYSAFVHGPWKLAAWVAVAGLLFCFGVVRSREV